MNFSRRGQNITSPLPSILISVFLFMMAVGLLNIFLSVRMSLNQVNAQVIGLVMACYFVGMVLGPLYARPIIARVGHIRSFTAFAAVATGSVILHGLYDSLWVWALLRVMTGFSLAGMYMVVESWLQETASRGNRGTLFSLYMISNYTGIAAGQLMLNAGDPQGQQSILLIGLLLALCLVPIALTHARHPAQIEAHTVHFFDFLGKAPLGSLGSFSSGLILGAYISLTPAWAVQRGLETVDISVLMALSMLGGLLLQWPVGKLSDRYDRSLLMVGLSGAMLVLPIGFLFNFNIFGLTLACATLFGGLSYSIYPMSVCHANDHAEDDQFIITATVLLLLYGIGASLGPVLGALFMWLVGPSGLFLFIMLTGLPFVWLTWRWRDRTRDLHQTAFIPVPRTTPQASTLDPRAEAEVTTAP